MSSGFTLYRLYSSADELLYIGKTIHRFPGSMNTADASLGLRSSAGVAFDTLMIEQKNRVVIIPHLLVLSHDHVQVVQDEPLSIEPCRDNGVVLFPDVVPQDNDPKVISGNPCLDS
jgi:hypothetical protein